MSVSRKTVSVSKKNPDFFEFYAGEFIRDTMLIWACLEGRSQAGSNCGRLTRKKHGFISGSSDWGIVTSAKMAGSVLQENLSRLC
jgi:hypothetical protein